jgi:IS30 family transposase
MTKDMTTGLDEGMSVRAIAKVLGVSPSTAQRDLAEQRAGRDRDLGPGRISVGWTRGTDGKLRPNRRFDTTERDNQIRRLRQQRMSVRAIASEVGCSAGTVHRVLKASS